MVSEVQRVGESVVSRAEGGVRSTGRLMHEQVWKRSHCYLVFEVRFRFKLDEKEKRLHGCKLMVESRSRALVAGGSALAVVSWSLLIVSWLHYWDHPFPTPSPSLSILWMSKLFPLAFDWWWCCASKRLFNRYCKIKIIPPVSLLQTRLNAISFYLLTLYLVIFGAVIPLWVNINDEWTLCYFGNHRVRHFDRVINRGC